MRDLDTHPRNQPQGRLSELSNRFSHGSQGPADAAAKSHDFVKSHTRRPPAAVATAAQRKDAADAAPAAAAAAAPMPLFRVSRGAARMRAPRRRRRASAKPRSVLFDGLMRCNHSGRERLARPAVGCRLDGRVTCGCRCLRAGTCDDCMRCADCGRRGAGSADRWHLLRSQLLARGQGGCLRRLLRLTQADVSSYSSLDTRRGRVQVLMQKWQRKHAPAQAQQSCQRRGGARARAQGSGSPPRLPGLRRPIYLDTNIWRMQATCKASHWPGARVFAALRCLSSFSRSACVALRFGAAWPCWRRLSLQPLLRTTGCAGGRMAPGQAVVWSLICCCVSPDLT